MTTTASASAAPRYDCPDLPSAFRLAPPWGGDAHRTPADWAGLGYPHRLVYWTDRLGYPRSLIVAPHDPD